MSEKHLELAPKEALAVLHKLNAAVGWRFYLPEATAEEQALREQIWTALHVLRLAIHGKAPLDTASVLCDVCSLRYVPIDNPFVFLKDDSGCHKAPCTECLERLKAEGKIARIENWETGEVTQC
jgi:hypothetical protein